MKMFFCEACQLKKQTKRVLRYLKGTEGLGIHFEKSISISLVGFTDSDVVAKQLIWLRKMISALDCNQSTPTERQI